MPDVPTILATLASALAGILGKLVHDLRTTAIESKATLRVMQVQIDALHDEHTRCARSLEYLRGILKRDLGVDLASAVPESLRPEDPTGSHPIDDYVQKLAERSRVTLPEEPTPVDRPVDRPRRVPPPAPRGTKR